LSVGTSVTLQQQQTVADPGQVDLVKKYNFKHYAVLSRELALHKIATATCLSDRVYWALILTSCCGPEVREGCFLRNAETGYLVTVEKDQLFPLRVKHLLAMLGLDPRYRGKIHQAIKKLIDQGCLREHGPEKIWYPLLDPKFLKAETEKRKKRYQKSSTLAYSFLPPFLRNALPDELSVNQDATSPVAEAWLKDLKKRYKSALEKLRKSYADETRKHFFDDRIIIEEEVEDIEEDERGGIETTSSVENPEQTRSSPPPSPPAVIPKPQPEPVTAVVVSKTPAHKLFEVFCFIMKGCGRPVSVVRMDACRQTFFQYPIEVQQRIVDDATIRSQRKWDDPAFIPDPLKYLKSQVWDSEPITARKFAPARPPTQKEKAAAAMKAHMERVWAREENGNGGTS
jgi:hypothetical protein